MPPDPPQTHVHAMPYREMAEMMGMDDRARFGKVMLDRLEWRDADESTYEWDAAAWYGGDFNKVWLETEGEHVDGRRRRRARRSCSGIASRPRGGARALGVRQDFGDGPARNWLAVRRRRPRAGLHRDRSDGVSRRGGRTALRLSADYDLLITQRLVLQPEVELNVYGSDDPERLIGAGLSDLEAGLAIALRDSGARSRPISA